MAEVVVDNYDKKVDLAEGALICARFLARYVIRQSGDAELRAQAASTLQDIRRALMELVPHRHGTVKTVAEAEPPPGREDHSPGSAARDRY